MAYLPTTGWQASAVWRSLFRAEGEMDKGVRENWPDFSADAVSSTVEAMHLFSQVAGKVRMGLMPHRGAPTYYQRF